MANPQWKISGDYFEACSCDSVCPCPTSGLAGRPTQGSCDAGLVFHVERGTHGTTTLDGLSFAVLLHTPGPMIAGNWTVGVIVDERAGAAQREALVAIGSGQGGGPMAAVGPLVSTFAGVESKPITIERSGMRRSVSIPGVVDIAVEGDALEFARGLGGEVTGHGRFGTAVVRFPDGRHWDVVTARRETYAAPAALPGRAVVKVCAGDADIVVEHDLQSRHGGIPTPRRGEGLG